MRGSDALRLCLWFLSLLSADLSLTETETEERDTKQSPSHTIARSLSQPPPHLDFEAAGPRPRPSYLDDPISGLMPLCSLKLTLKIMGSDLKLDLK